MIIDDGSPEPLGKAADKIKEISSLEKGKPLYEVDGIKIPAYVVKELVSLSSVKIYV